MTAAPRPSLWQRILERLQAGGRALRALIHQPTDPTDNVAFSIAFIALAAKLAKADGVVTRDEVTMFRRVFEIPPEEERNAARVYDLCRQDTTGYEAYARQLSRALGSSEAADTLREDVLDGLFHIAMADGEYHPAEDAFLRRTAEIFAVPDAAFARLMARHVPDARDPFLILGVEPDVTTEQLRVARRTFLRENHPDRLVSKGLPPEMIELATARVAAYNDAHSEVLALVRSRAGEGG